MGKQISSDQIKAHPLHDVVQRSFSIVRHVDFFLWLQDGIATHLPHDVLIAAWGDFKSGKIHYDISSNIPGLRTQALHERDVAVDGFSSDIYKKWVKNKKKWFAIHHFSIDSWCQDDESLLCKLKEMRSVIVYGMVDMRGKEDSLYMFFSKDETTEIFSNLLETLMPHIDAALRRVEWLAVDSEKTIESLLASDNAEFTQREHEILHWVKVGKSNYEIGKILDISPNTIKSHLKRIFAKLEVSTRAQAVSKYVNKKPIDE